MNMIVGYSPTSAYGCQTGGEIVCFGVCGDDTLRQHVDRVERDNPNLEIVAVKLAQLPGRATDE